MGIKIKTGSDCDLGWSLKRGQEFFNDGMVFVILFDEAMDYSRDINN